MQNVTERAGRQAGGTKPAQDPAAGFVFDPVIVLFGAVFWAVSFFAASFFLDSETLKKVFLFGAVSIPILYLLDRVLLAVIPKGAPAERASKKDAGFTSGRDQDREQAQVRSDAAYVLDLKIHGALKVVFVAALYYGVAKGSPQPFMAVAVGAVVFALAVPQHLYRFWKRDDCPDPYSRFLLAHGSFQHRAVSLAVVLGLQLLLIAFTG